MKDFENKITPAYIVGDEVYIKSRHAGEPDDIGIVAEVHDCTRHFYYYVDYIDSSGRYMRMGTGEDGIRGLVPRREKVINPVIKLVN